MLPMNLLTASTSMQTPARRPGGDVYTPSPVAAVPKATRAVTAGAAADRLATRRATSFGEVLGRRTARPEGRAEVTAGQMGPADQPARRSKERACCNAVQAADEETSGRREGLRPESGAADRAAVADAGPADPELEKRRPADQTEANADGVWTGLGGDDCLADGGLDEEGDVAGSDPVGRPIRAVDQPETLQDDTLPGDTSEQSVTTRSASIHADNFAVAVAGDLKASMAGEMPGFGRGLTDEVAELPAGASASADVTSATSGSQSASKTDASVTLTARPWPDDVTGQSIGADTTVQEAAAVDDGATLSGDADAMAEAGRRPAASLGVVENETSRYADLAGRVAAGRGLASELSATRPSAAVGQVQDGAAPHAPTGGEDLASTNVPAAEAGGEASDANAATGRLPEDDRGRGGVWPGNGRLMEGQVGGMPTAGGPVVPRGSEALTGWASAPAALPADVSARGAGGVETASYTPEARFYATHAGSFVQAVRTRLLPDGGTVLLRLDPPELGAVQVSLVLKDKQAMLTFQAENAEAARLLSQTMARLRDTLSNAGITVDRIQVQQSSKSENGGGSSHASAGGGGGWGQPGAFAEQDEQARREQQRRELLERLWLQAAGVERGVLA